MKTYEGMIIRVDPLNALKNLDEELVNLSHFLGYCSSHTARLFYLTIRLQAVQTEQPNRTDLFRKKLNQKTRASFQYMLQT